MLLHDQAKWEIQRNDFSDFTMLEPCWSHDRLSQLNLPVNSFYRHMHQTNCFEYKTAAKSLVSPHSQNFAVCFLVVVGIGTWNSTFIRVPELCQI